MPETLASLVAFLLLVTPGLVFELLRERARPQRNYSAFRETAVVVVGSVAFSTLALLVLLGFRAWLGAGLADPEALLEEPGAYLREHPERTGRSLALGVALATAIGWVWHLVLSRTWPGADIRPNPAWFEITDGSANPRRQQVLAYVELKNGSAARGFIKGYDFTAESALRTLTLSGRPGSPLRVRNATSGRHADLHKDWAYIVIPAEEIGVAHISYGPPVKSTGPRTWWRRLALRIGQWLLAKAG